MSRRAIVFCALAVVAAAVFVRLGVWQLARLHEKLRRNAAIVAQQSDPPVQLGSLPRDTAGAHYRPAVASGRLDYEHEIVLGSRTHEGSPGVDLITPLRMPGTDTAVLVNRGWVYSPDGASVDLRRWHEGDTITISGYVETYGPDAGSTHVARQPRLVRRISRSEVANRVPYPLAPYYLVQTSDSADGPHPARRTIPALDEGPHRSYALQWFSFAAIALGGAALMVARERRGGAETIRTGGPGDAAPDPRA
jgi:surfeit locus 1 family protein